MGLCGVLSRLVGGGVVGGGGGWGGLGSSRVIVIHERLQYSARWRENEKI